MDDNGVNLCGCEGDIIPGWYIMSDFVFVVYVFALTFSCPNIQRIQKFTKSLSITVKQVRNSYFTEIDVLNYNTQRKCFNIGNGSVELQLIFVFQNESNRFPVSVVGVYCFEIILFNSTKDNN